VREAFEPPGQEEGLPLSVLPERTQRRGLIPLSARVSLFEILPVRRLERTTRTKDGDSHDRPISTDRGPCEGAIFCLSPRQSCSLALAMQLQARISRFSRSTKLALSPLFLSGYLGAFCRHHLGSGYGKVRRELKTATSHLGPQERAPIFGGTAIEVYRLDRSKER
jgi:hypothetical protein